MFHRRDFLASAASISILPTTDPGISRVIADEVPDDGGPTGEYITTPEEHGWDNGNTVEQNSLALRTATDIASWNARASSTGRGVVELKPGKTYVVRPPSDANGSRDRPTGALYFNYLIPNVEVRTAGKPNVGSGQQATLQMESWAGKSGMHNRSIISIDSGRNLFFGWLRLDGNKFSIGGNGNLNKIEYKQGDNGGLHCIAIQGCDGVVFEQVEAFNALTDGMRLDQEHATGPGHVAGDVCRDLLVFDCDFHHCRRCALGVIAAGDPNDSWGVYDQVIFRRVKFRWAGDDDGLAGEAPGSNIDFEPNNKNDRIDGVTLQDCDIEDTIGSTYAHGAPRQGRTAGRGWMMDSRAGHVSTKMRFRNVRIRGSQGAEGYAFVLYARGGARFDDWEVVDVRAEGNKSNRMHFNADIGGGRLTNFRIENFGGDLIQFTPTLDTAGHSVTIWKGAYNPEVNASGRQTVIVKDGFR